MRKKTYGTLVLIIVIGVLLMAGVAVLVFGSLFIKTREIVRTQDQIVPATDVVSVDEAVNHEEVAVSSSNHLVGTFSARLEMSEHEEMDYFLTLHDDTFVLTTSGVSDGSVVNEESGTWRLETDMAGRQLVVLEAEPGQVGGLIGEPGVTFEYFQEQHQLNLIDFDGKLWGVTGLHLQRIES